MHVKIILFDMENYGKINYFRSLEPCIFQHPGHAFFIVKLFTGLYREFMYNDNSNTKMNIAVIILCIQIL